MGNGNHHFHVKEFLIRAAVGMLFVGIVAVPIMILVLKDEADPTWIQRVVIYVCLAIASGIIFSVATVSSGKVGWGKVGVSLGGGAAIGVGTMILFHRLLPPPPPLAVFQPAATGFITMQSSGPAIARVIPIGNNTYVIERKPNGSAADAEIVFDVMAPSPGSMSRRTVRCRVSRIGRITILKDEEPTS